MKNYLFQILLFSFIISALSRSTTKCCDGFGCFSDEAPYNGQPLPMCPHEIEPILTMYNHEHRVNGIIFDPATVPPIFNSTLRTVFIVHGWMNSDDTRWMIDMKAALINRENVNVVLLDWHKGADLLLYPDSAANTRSVGAYLAASFNTLVNKGKSLSNLFWCIGHSLGAHVCGQAGMRSNYTMGRATGLDPAGPWFQYSDDLTVGINPSSAIFVDIMHASNVYGTFRPLGHMDFYPDGGKTLTGCTTDVCAHNLAPKIMIESIYSDCFMARQICPSNDHMPKSCSYCVCGVEACAMMGYAADRGCLRSGIFYLETNRKAPYCKG